MRGCPRAIRYHSVVLAPFPTPESARFGLCIDRHTKNRPLQDELVYNPISFMWARFGNMRGFPMQANFFAVIMNPNTRAGAAGVTKPPFRVQKKGKPRQNPQQKTSRNSGVGLDAKAEKELENRQGGKSRIPFLSWGLFVHSGSRVLFNFPPSSPAMLGAQHRTKAVLGVPPPGGMST